MGEACPLLPSSLPSDQSEGRVASLAVRPYTPSKSENAPWSGSTRKMVFSLHSFPPPSKSMLFEIELGTLVRSPGKLEVNELKLAYLASHPIFRLESIKS